MLKVIPSYSEYKELMTLKMKERCVNFFCHTFAGAEARSFINGPLYDHLKNHSPNTAYLFGAMEFYNTLIGFHVMQEKPQAYKVDWCKKNPKCACSKIRSMCFRKKGGLFKLRENIGSWNDEDKELFIWMTRKFIGEKTNFYGPMSEGELSQIKGSIDAARHFFYYDLGCIVNEQKKESSNGSYKQN